MSFRGIHKYIKDKYIQRGKKESRRERVGIKKKEIFLSK